jgi:hypothetical protein
MSGTPQKYLGDATGDSLSPCKAATPPLSLSLPLHRIRRWWEPPGKACVVPIAVASRYRVALQDTWWFWRWHGALVMMEFIPVAVMVASGGLAAVVGVINGGCKLLGTRWHGCYAARLSPSWPDYGHAGLLWHSSGLSRRSAVCGASWWSGTLEFDHSVMVWVGGDMVI